MDSPKDALARIKRAFAGPLIDRDSHGRERRRAELLYTCEIRVNGQVVARTQGRRLPMSCPSTRAGKFRLSPSPFSVSVQIPTGSAPQNDHESALVRSPAHRGSGNYLNLKGSEM